MDVGLVRTLAQPVSIGAVELRNRIVLAPVSTNYADGQGHVTEKTLGFYEERARGGAGALILEASSVDRRARMFVKQHGLHDDSHIPGMATLARRVHSHGSRLFVQICHGGPKTIAMPDDSPPISASEVPVKVGTLPRAMTREEIERAVEDFASAAVRAREAGFDGVEVHGAHFYLLSAFLSGHFNRRTDEYGGSVENRARFICRVIQAVKARAGADYPIICRINGLEEVPGGIDGAQSQEIARLLVAAGADAIHVSAGVREVNPKIASLYSLQLGGIPPKGSPHGCFVEYAARVKQAVGVPVVAVGRLDDPAAAERVLRDGAADLVAIGRGLIADPCLPAKLLGGRWEEVVRCDECMSCQTTLRSKGQMNCSVNPRPWLPKGQ